VGERRIQRDRRATVEVFEVGGQGRSVRLAHDLRALGADPVAEKE